MKTTEERLRESEQSRRLAWQILQELRAVLEVDDLGPCLALTVFGEHTKQLLSTQGAGRAWRQLIRAELLEKRLISCLISLTEIFD